MHSPANRLVHCHRPAAAGTDITLVGVRRGRFTRSKIAINDLIVGVPRQAAADRAFGAKYSFRQWEAHFTLPAKGNYTLMVRCTNSDGVAQPAQGNWNPSGFMRNVIEATAIAAA
jgi:hypothetical protein